MTAQDSSATRSDIEAVGMKVDRLEMSLWEEQARRRRLRENVLGGAISALLGVLVVEIFDLFNAGFFAIVAFVVVLVVGYVYYRKIIMEAPKEEPKQKKVVRLSESLDATDFFPALFSLILKTYPLPEFACVFPSEFAEGSGSITIRRLVGEKAIECLMDVDLSEAEAEILFRHDNDRKKCEELLKRAQNIARQEGRTGEETSSA